MAKAQPDFFAKPEFPMTDKASASRAKKPADASDSYNASSIDVLEGLEPVRRHPGMYIGGTDEKALHHLFAEVIDNSMDEAVAGHASWIEVRYTSDGFLSVTDNGRGIPVDAHPKFKNKSALEVIMTTLHSGGKFDAKNYNTSGGLHGVGVSVVNALSEHCEVEVARGQQLYRMAFSRGAPVGKLEQLGPTMNRRGTTIRFKPDAQIFGPDLHFKPERLLKMARSKAYLFGGVEIRWFCDAEMATKDVPTEAVFRFPGGLKEFLAARIDLPSMVTTTMFAGKATKTEGHGSVEWAVAWITNEDGFSSSYCNTIPTAEGGTHENGLRQALYKGLRAYGDLTNNKKAVQITADDVMGTAASMLSLFIRGAAFQGQTKEKLSTQDATKIVETAVRLSGPSSKPKNA
jgi:topoisomerase IV subunit B